MKEEEKTTKKIIEELHNEMSQKRDFINDLEFKLSSLTDELKMKQNEFSIIESKMEQFGKEKEVYRKNKFESVQLEKQVFYIIWILLYFLRWKKLV